VEVVDTGVGIAQDEKVFHSFTTSKPGGMGLGLNIVQRITSVLGGEIGYSSQPGKGTTFRLSLPRC
jgi:signal transduction histidine kinase